MAKMGFLGKCNKIVNVQTLFFLGSNLFILIFFGSSCNQKLFSFSNVKPGSLLIDTSTIEPAVAQEMGKLTQSKGATFLDAPVSGGRLCFSSNNV